MRSLQWFTQWLESSNRLDDDKQVTKDSFKGVMLSNSSLLDCLAPLLQGVFGPKRSVSDIELGYPLLFMVLGRLLHILTGFSCPNNSPPSTP